MVITDEVIAVKVHTDAADTLMLLKAYVIMLWANPSFPMVVNIQPAIEISLGA
jgi:hypothetical protein